MKFYGLVAGVALTTAEVEGARRNGNRGNNNNRWNNNNNRIYNNNKNKDPNHVDNFGIPNMRPSPNAMWRDIQLAAAANSLRDQVHHAEQGKQQNGLGLMSNMRNPAMGQAYQMHAANEKLRDEVKQAEDNIQENNYGLMTNMRPGPNMAQAYDIHAENQNSEDDSENTQNDGSTDAEIAQAEAAHPVNNDHFNNLWSNLIGNKDLNTLSIETDEAQERILAADSFSVEDFSDNGSDASLQSSANGSADNHKPAEDSKPTRPISVFGGLGGRPFPRPILKTAGTDSGTLDACDQEMGVKGMCRAMFTRWTYNSETNSCQTFSYGGCAGNDNNFVSESECKQTCVPTVVIKAGFKKGAGRKNQKKDCSDMTLQTGWCRAYMPLFSYDQKTKRCVQVIDGGCGAETDNKFDTEDECKDMCEGNDDLSGDNVSSRSAFPQSQEPDFNMPQTGFSMDDFLTGGFPEFEQNLPNSNVPCTNSDPCGCAVDSGFGGYYRRQTRYYFDKNTKKCETFTFRGFGGNGNSFVDEDLCNKICQDYVESDSGAQGSQPGFNPLNPFGSLGQSEPTKTQAEIDEINRKYGHLPERCLDKKIQPGMCRAAFYYYNFNTDTGKCETAVFGGCNDGGTTNTFDEIEDCQAACEVDAEVAVPDDNEEERRSLLPEIDSSADTSSSSSSVDQCNQEFKKSDVNIQDAHQLLNFSRGFPGAQLTLHTYYVFDTEKNRCKMVKYFMKKEGQAFETENLFEKFGRCMQTCRPDAYAANAARRGGGKK